MKQSIAKFLLYVLVEHIQEDWEGISKNGQRFLYPFWLIRGFFIWLICPIFIPYYLFKQSKLYKNLEFTFKQAIINEKKNQQLKNKVNTQNFIAGKKVKSTISVTKKFIG